MTNQEIDQVLRSPALPPLASDRVRLIETVVLADLKPVQPLAPARVYLAGFSGIFLAVCVIACTIVGYRGWLVLSSLQKLCVFALLGLSVGFLVFSIVSQMTPAAKHVRLTALASAASFAFLLLMMGVIFSPMREPGFLRDGLACFRTGMAFAVPAALFFAPLLLRGAGLSPLLTGATAGALAGLVGLAVLEIHCPNLNVYHIVVWHVSVTLVCAIAGLVFSSVTFRRWTSNH